MKLAEYTYKHGRIGIAQALGIGAANVYQWETGRRPVPPEHCPVIERVTGRLVTCEEMRPDVDWAYLRGSAVPQLPTPAPLEAAR